jgi:hypothetical protein
MSEGRYKEAVDLFRQCEVDFSNLEHSAVIYGTRTPWEPAGIKSARDFFDIVPYYIDNYRVEPVPYPEVDFKRFIEEVSVEIKRINMIIEQELLKR